MIGIGFGPFRGPGPLNGGQIENAGSADRKNGTGKSNSLIPNARRIQCESFLHGADEAPRSNPSFHRVFPFPIPHAVEYILRVATFCLFEIPSENTFPPPSLSTLRYMEKNSVRLNWSNARKLTTSSGKKIPRFFAEKKKSYPSKVTPCASWRYSYIFYPTSHRIRFYAWIRFSLDTCLSCIISVWNIPTRNRVPSRWI